MMRFKLIKLLCIVGAGVLGAVIVGHPLAALLAAPFGWIFGRAVELTGVEKGMPLYDEPLVQGAVRQEEDDWMRQGMYENKIGGRPWWDGDPVLDPLMCESIYDDE